jgi:hypothetical protein
MKMKRYLRGYILFSLIFTVLLLSACSYDLEKSIEQGDVVNVHGQIYNYVVFETFLENVNKKEPDEIRIVNYTVEGDPIFYDMKYDGSSINLQIDNSKDKYRGNGSSKIKAKCNEIVTEEEASIYYALENCDSDSPSKSFQILNVSEIKD